MSISSKGDEQGFEDVELEENPLDAPPHVATYDRKKEKSTSKTFIVMVGVSTVLMAIVTAALVGCYVTEVGVFAPSTTTTSSPATSSPTTSTVITATTTPDLPDYPDNVYYVGTSRTDVTGPIVQVNMMGYAHPDQIANGLHTRLYSRAYVIADNKMKSRVAFVAFDGGMTSQLMKLEVVRRLKETHGDLFAEKNVVLSGSHTHSGPAGFFQYLLFEVTSLGHVEQSTEAFVSGIVSSIIEANSNLKPTVIKMGVGDVTDGNINRSPTSYLLNPYAKDTDQEMTLLRMENFATGEPVGMVSWYPVHLTSMNFSNLLINSDNKGRASALFEKQMRKPGETLGGQESFVGVFAQSNLGDVSPRTDGPICVDTGRECDALSSTCRNRLIPGLTIDDPTLCVGFGPGADMFDSTDIIARRQLATANDIFDGASDELTGSVDFIHQYVDMSKEHVLLDDGSTVSTCKAGMGYSFAAGCTDGAGARPFRQGMNATIFWDGIRDLISMLVCSTQPTQEYWDCHGAKPVLLPTGFMDIPRPWHPNIVDVQMLKIGQLVIAAVPGEFTTMAGRRLRDTITNKLVEQGMPADTKVVIAGLANVYSHYMTTFEEYQAQRYEAASTIFGPHTTRAYQQKFEELAAALASGNVDSVVPGPDPDYSPQSQSPIAPLPANDAVPDGVNFGDVVDDAAMTYEAGETVTVRFYGANPRHDMKLGSTYLKVERKDEASGAWETVFTDADWETKFTWEERNATAPAGEVTLLDALFDVIAHVSGMRFDIRKAMELEEMGKFPYEDFQGKDGLLEAMEKAGLLYPETKENAEPFIGPVESLVTIEWTIPEDALGTYRIVYNGNRKSAAGVTPIQGQSREFEVLEPPTGSGFRELDVQSWLRTVFHNRRKEN